MADWREHGFVVGMPHMVPGWLSPVELLKVLGDWQWTAVADALGRPIDQVAAEDGERLYASFASVDVGFPAARPLPRFGEGARVHARGRVAAYGRRFVEGLYLFDADPLPAGATDGVRDPASLAEKGLPWASLTSTFVARQGGNARLKVVEPVGADTMPPLGALPAGLAEHQVVAATGRIAGEPAGPPLAPAATFAWPILPESDLNGAGLLYFARYVAIQDFAIRRLLGEGLDRPVSAPLIARLATTRQRVFYFANAEPWDTVRVRVQGWARPSEAAGFVFRADLFRGSDGVWMAAALAEKALVVPEGDKALRLEAGRLLASLGG